MAKIISLVLVMAVVAFGTAEAGRLRNSKQSRFFARQEIADDVPAQTPYPPSGIKPDVPFDLPNEPQQPQEPDNTYLPPDNLLPPAQTYGPPDQFYGTPEASGDDGTQDDDAVEIIPQPSEQPEEEQTEASQDDESELVPEEPEAEEIENPQSERLVLARSFRKQSRRPAKLRLAKLRSAKLQALPAARVRSQRLIAQPIYSTKGALIAFKVLRA